MASQITGISIVCLAACSGKQKAPHHWLGDGFPSQRASNADTAYCQQYIFFFVQNFHLVLPGQTLC